MIPLLAFFMLLCPCDKAERCQELRRRITHDAIRVKSEEELAAGRNLSSILEPCLEQYLITIYDSLPLKEQHALVDRWGNPQTPAACSFLQQRLFEGHPHIQSLILETLANSATCDSCETLAKFALTATQRDQLATLVVALTQCRDPSSLKSLEHLLHHADHATAAFAASALIEMNDARADQILKNYLTTGRNGFVRQAIENMMESRATETEQ